MDPEELDVLWADAQLIGIQASYDAFELALRETTGRAVRVVALGHIGFQLVGFWDETVIDSADLVPAHPFADLCVGSIAERLGGFPPATGSPARNGPRFTTLVVSLSDGATILCTAAAFQTAAM
jgi:hypothetical protein